MRIRVIAIAGRMSAGKTWSATYLAAKYNGIKLSFAQPLKMDLVECGLSSDAVFDKKPEHIRKLLQDYGQAWRKEDPKHWVRIMRDVLRPLSCAGYQLAIIDDLRFANEADTLRRLWDAELFRIRRVDPPTLREQAAEAFKLSHVDVSEHDLENWDDWALMIDAASGDLVSIASQLDNYMNGGKGDVSEGDSTRQPRG